MELFSLSREKFLIFQETENQKKLPIFSQKKVLFTFRETKTPKKFIIFQEKELYYISGKGTFLYFWKCIFLASYFSYISGGNFPISKNKKPCSEKISYISGNGIIIKKLNSLSTSI